MGLDNIPDIHSTCFQNSQLPVVAISHIYGEFDSKDTDKNMSMCLSGSMIYKMDKFKFDRQL